MTVFPRLSRVNAGLLLAVLASLSPAAAQTADDPAPLPPVLTLPEDPEDGTEGPAAGPPSAQDQQPELPGMQPPAPMPAPRSEVPPPADKGPPGKAEAPEATPEQHAKLLDELYARLATAPDQTTANQIAGALEQLWQHSGSPTADLLVARAVAAVEAQNRDLAMKLLNAAVELQPDYAEAWNRRAYLFYVENDYKRALGDLRRVLALDPRNYKALEGLANLLNHLGEKKAALEAYDSALKVHPSLPDAKKARDELKIEVEGQGI